MKPRSAGHLHVMRSGLLFILLCLSGCGLPDFRWRPIAEAGPYIAEAQRSQLLQKCDAPVVMVDVRRCDFAFSTKDGVLNIYRELVPLLDEYVKNLPEFEAWPRGYAGKKNSPYAFVLLSLEPTIVVAIPVAPDRQSVCTSILSCVTSNAIVSGYTYKPEARIVAGSLWFSPGTTRGMALIPTDVSHFRFQVPKIEASLIREGSQWKFVRKS